MNNLKTVHRGAVNYNPTLQQIALAYGFEEEIRNFRLPSSYFVSHRKQVEINRDLVAKAFIHAGMRLTIADGGSCMLVDWSPLKNQLPNIHGGMMGEKYLRFCYNKRHDTLMEVARRLDLMKDKLKPLQN